MQPAEEDVAAGLHQVLSSDDALPLVGSAAGTCEALEHGGLSLLELEEQRIPPVAAEQEQNPGPRADASHAHNLAGEIHDPEPLKEHSPIRLQGASVVAPRLAQPLFQH